MNPGVCEIDRLGRKSTQYQRHTAVVESRWRMAVGSLRAQFNQAGIEVFPVALGGGVDDLAEQLDILFAQLLHRAEIVHHNTAVPAESEIAGMGIAVHRS